MEEKAPPADAGFEKLTGSHATVYRTDHFRGRAQGAVEPGLFKILYLGCKMVASSRKRC